MQALELVEVIRLMTPTRFEVVRGCVLWPEHHRPSDDEVDDALRRLQSAYIRQSTPGLAAVRARAAFERQYNRRFIQSELEHVGVLGLKDEHLLTLADHWAAILRDALRCHFDDRPFVVEVVGAHLVDEEPLEVCVTFQQLAPKTGPTSMPSK
jgi:hypothetical protein